MKSVITNRFFIRQFAVAFACLASPVAASQAVAKPGVVSTTCRKRDAFIAEKKRNAAPARTSSFDSAVENMIKAQIKR
jgi:hypothetical protein